MVVDDLDTAATRSLAIGVIAAATLLALTAILIRWSLKREATVRAIEQARHLASLGQMSAVLAHEIRNPLASAAWPCNIMSRAARTLRCVVHTIATRATPISPIAATTAERDRRDRERGSGTEAITVA